MAGDRKVRKMVWMVAGMVVFFVLLSLVQCDEKEREIDDRMQEECLREWKQKKERKAARKNEEKSR